MSNSDHSGQEQDDALAEGAVRGKHARAADSYGAEVAGADEVASAEADGGDAAEGGKNRKKKHSPVFWVVLVIVILVVLVAVVYAGYVVYEINYNSAEADKRESWAVETGDLSSTDEDYSVNVYDFVAESDLAVLQIQPTEVEDEDFTYYDEDVQERLAGTVEDLKASDSWTFEEPLAILSPYGTGSNGLYLYFETEEACEVSYTIQAEGTSDYSATASGGYATEHELQLIGLVPGLENHVTMTLTDESGEVVATMEFDIAMPETSSGYSTQLEYTDGESTTELSNGLYVILRVNGYLGYGFFYDNDGTMRYEMVTEGLGLDRIVEYDGDIIVCVSDCKIARIDELGHVVQIYDLEGDYVLHHDINYSVDGKLLVAAEHADSDEKLIEDLVLELDLETGEYYELVDFSELMSDYREEYTSPVGLFSLFVYEVSYWDWLHLNTVQYLEDGDSLIISSRESSTIIKIEDVHTDPEIVWMCGNPDIWEGTGYEDLLLEQVGDFKYHYGQHTVEYAGAGDEDGVYYLRVFDNNFWYPVTRDDVELDEDELEAAVTGAIAGDKTSYVYIYKIDENEGTFELVFSFEVPFSNVVCSVAPADVWSSYSLDTEDELYDMSDTNWVVNSGVSKVFGEYDSDGVLIRQFSYEASLQAYRVIKYSFEGFWFAEEDETVEDAEAEAVEDADEEDAEADGTVDEEELAAEETSDAEASGDEETAAEDAAATSEDAVTDEDASSEESDADSTDADGSAATDDGALEEDDSTEELASAA